MNVIFKILKQKIEEKFGQPILYSRQCMALSEDIFEKTGELLSLVTLKRLLGFTSAEVLHRVSTLDIIASYCGYSNYEMMRGDLIDSALISNFRPIDRIESKNLLPLAEITVTYDPDRKITFRYLGNFRYEVVESVKSKLEAGDIVFIDSFNKGFELIASNVIRNCEDLGPYVAAGQGGLLSIELLGGDN